MTTPERDEFDRIMREKSEQLERFWHQKKAIQRNLREGEELLKRIEKQIESIRSLLHRMNATREVPPDLRDVTPIEDAFFDDDFSQAPDAWEFH